MIMLIRDYYIVKVPGVAAETLDKLADLAIREARDRTKLYCLPAEWTATCISGEVGSWEVTFRVRRTRNKR